MRPPYSIKVIKYATFFLCSLSLINSASGCPTGKELESDSGLGQVVFSVLSVAEFQKYNGPEWVLLDGSGLSGDKDLSKNVGRLPDARGVFIRIKNNGRSGSEGNPDGDVGLGTYQWDALQEHTHSMTFGQHTNSFGYPDRAGREAAGPIIETNGIRTGRSSSETRPRNITLNAFVKVKLKCRQAIHDRVDLLKTEIETKVQNMEASLTKEIGKISKKIVESYNVKELLNEYIRRQVEDEVQKRMEEILKQKIEGSDR